MKRSNLEFDLAKMLELKLVLGRKYQRVSEVSTIACENVRVRHRW